ncbi:oncostatin-M [Fukomys damarensis]|uniref:Oncostatin-M n=1 Tax=Fukomys damarensis TaxID=885580 RepID=A0A091DLF7_FUKDA|nr:oncostatin-M [Fukomys damarensis]KFO23636.1 Oncostatin-M [Fukomys damarensis]
MRAQLTRRTLFSLVLGLLLLSPAAEAAAATCRCSTSYGQLLGQLRSQADLMKDTSRLLDPFIRSQGLDTPVLRGSCKECSRAFPSEDALRRLSRQGFLRTVSATLNDVLQRLAALQQHLLKGKNVPEMQVATRNIQGVRNNIYCMLELLTNCSETPEPLLPGTAATLTPPTPSFWFRLEGCQFLCGYHSFMGSVGQVFGEWGDSLSGNRTHSPRRRALYKGARRARPSRRVKRPVPRGQLFR